MVQRATQPESYFFSGHGFKSAPRRLHLRSLRKITLRRRTIGMERKSGEAARAPSDRSSSLEWLSHRGPQRCPDPGGYPGAHFVAGVVKPRSAAGLRTHEKHHSNCARLPCRQPGFPQARQRHPAKKKTALLGCETAELHLTKAESMGSSGQPHRRTGCVNL
jgi:hypothetical protein